MNAIKYEKLSQDSRSRVALWMNISKQYVENETYAREL